MTKIILSVFLLTAPQFLSCARAADATAAVIALEARERLIPSPDPAAEPVRFFITTEDPALGIDKPEFKDVIKWQIQIYDSQKRKVSYIQGTGRPTEYTIPWNGLTASGKPLPDGFYKARFTWADSEGKLHGTPAVMVSLQTALSAKNWPVPDNSIEL